jgi:BlaI family penicillinase repressor
MTCVWRRGRVTADEVTKALRGRLTNASVRTVLRRIEMKGFLTHGEEGRTFVYVPTVEPPTAARGALRRLLDRFYGGSGEQLIVGLLDGRMIDRRQLTDLARQVSAFEAADRRRKAGR